MTETAHTPLPWRAGDSEIFGADDSVVCTVHWRSGDDCHQANLETIVHAVNSHHDLIEALREARTELSLTRTNIMCEINRCADPRDSRWEGVPEILKERIAKIDAILTKAEAGHG